MDAMVGGLIPCLDRSHLQEVGQECQPRGSRHLGQLENHRRHVRQRIALVLR